MRVVDLTQFKLNELVDPITFHSQNHSLINCSCQVAECISSKWSILLKNWSFYDFEFDLRVEYTHKCINEMNNLSYWREDELTSVRRFAITQPALPAPTTMKSYSLSKFGWSMGSLFMWSTPSLSTLNTEVRRGGKFCWRVGATQLLSHKTKYAARRQTAFAPTFFVIFDWYICGPDWQEKNKIKFKNWVM